LGLSYFYTIPLEFRTGGSIVSKEAAGSKRLNHQDIK